MPLSSEARTSAAVVSASMGECSLSMMAKSSPVRPRHSIRLTLAVSKKVPIGRAPAASFCLSVFSMRIPPCLVSIARLYVHFGGMASAAPRTFAPAA